MTSAALLFVLFKIYLLKRKRSVSQFLPAALWTLLSQWFSVNVHQCFWWAFSPQDCWGWRDSSHTYVIHSYQSIQCIPKVNCFRIWCFMSSSRTAAQSWAHLCRRFNRGLQEQDRWREPSVYGRVSGDSLDTINLQKLHLLFKYNEKYIQILLLLRAFPAFSPITPSKKRRNRKTSPRTATLTFCLVNITPVFMKKSV